MVFRDRVLGQDDLRFTMELKPALSSWFSCLPKCWDYMHVPPSLAKTTAIITVFNYIVRVQFKSQVEGNGVC